MRSSSTSGASRSESRHSQPTGTGTTATAIARPRPCDPVRCKALLPGCQGDSRAADRLETATRGGPLSANGKLRLDACCDVLRGILMTSFERGDHVSCPQNRILRALSSRFGLSSLSFKNIPLSFFRKLCFTLTHPASIQGALRVVTNARRAAVDADVPIDERHRSRTVKSCGSGAPMQAPSWRRC
jgi:hypothetical protein